MVNVAVFKTTYHLHNGVDFTDVTEELIAEAFAGARAFHQSGDVDELDRRRNDLLRMGQLRECVEPRIRHRDDAEIRINCAEGIIRGLRFSGARNGVEERRLANVRQTNDSGAQHRRRE